MNDGIIKRYWVAYGGFNALFTSVYPYLSLVLTLLLFPAWLDKPWHTQALNIMPSVLGFSLGGYAILMALGDENFRALISGENEDGETSPYMVVNAAFVHFILLQIISIMLALVSSAYYFKLNPNGWVSNTIGDFASNLNIVVGVGNFIGYWVFIYALLSAIAATFAILRMSSWYDHMHSERLKKERSVMAKEIVSEDRFVELLNEVLREHEYYQDGMVVTSSPEGATGHDITGYSFVGGNNWPKILADVVQTVSDKYDVQVTG